MVRTRAIFVLFILYLSCASAYKGKCSIHDDSCQIDLYDGVLQDVAETGIPDLGIPVLDPYVHKNVELALMNLITIKSPEIVIRGLKTCEITKYHLDMKKNITTAAISCKLITSQGKYHVHMNPALNALSNDFKIHGDGYATFKIENLVVESEIPFILKKLSDGELHFVVQGDGIIFKYDILGKASVTINNLFIGSQDISAVAERIINENWQFLTKIYPVEVLRLGVKVFTKYANKFYRANSVEDLYLEDISAYLTQ